VFKDIELAFSVVGDAAGDATGEELCAHSVIGSQNPIAKQHAIPQAAHQFEVAGQTEIRQTKIRQTKLGQTGTLQTAKLQTGKL